MPYELPLPRKLSQHWRVKIFDREGPEEPHLTIIFKTTTWRVSLRNGRFLFPGGRWKDIPQEIYDAIWGESKQSRRNLRVMRAYWNAHNPGNPVAVGDEDLEELEEDKEQNENDD